MAFRNKAEYILPFLPDILVVPECEHIDKIQFPKAFKQQADKLWFGTNQHKGLGIFSFGKFKLTALDIHNPDYKMIVPIAVTNGQFECNLFAVWANNPADKDGHYVTQVWKAINYYDALLTEKPVLLVGDFNSNAIWDYKNGRIGDHSSVARFLEERNIFSAYHIYHQQERGKEEHPTWYMYRHQDKPYHLDYCFASGSFIDKLVSVEVGDFDAWTAHSDHVPIIVQFNLKKRRKG